MGLIETSDGMLINKANITSMLVDHSSNQGYYLAIYVTSGVCIKVNTSSREEANKELRRIKESWSD